MVIGHNGKTLSLIEEKRENAILLSNIKEGPDNRSPQQSHIWNVKFLLYVTFVFASFFAHSYTPTALPYRDEWPWHINLCTFCVLFQAEWFIYMNIQYALACINVPFVHMVLSRQPFLHYALSHCSYGISNGCSYVLLICIISHKPGEDWFLFWLSFSAYKKNYISMWDTFYAGLPVHAWPLNWGCVLKWNIPNN